MRDFKKLNIWKNAIELVKQVSFLFDKIPTDERFGLKSQFNRALVLVASNIAGGFSRNSEVPLIKTCEVLANK